MATFLYPYELDGNWGYIRENGVWSILPNFSEADFFSEGIAAFKSGERWGYLDEQGDIIITPQFVSAGPFSYGRAWVGTDRGYMLINTKGEMIVFYSFDHIEYVDPLNSEFYRFSREGKYGYMNKEGEIFIEALYDEASPFSEGVALVNRGNESYFINYNGERVLENKDYKPLEVFSDGLALVLFQNYWFGYINKQGEVVIPASPNVGSSFSEGMAYFYNPIKSKYGYINLNGEISIKPRYDSALPFVDGLAFVKQGDQSEMIDKKGKTVYCFPEGIQIDVETYSNKSKIISIRANYEEKLILRSSGQIIKVSNPVL
ncbi:WG repeat-containing protein [Paenibacillus ihumii]|uniref:WG repeat-containing protein n=1 Tax=Paenibacillus ihumii TaxID=687436 RepID=UPI0006D77B93|nr:WG repeat-containing protein [Paenibacillus ihumii]